MITYLSISVLLLLVILVQMLANSVQKNKKLEDEIFFLKRRFDKQASRDEDARRLAEGEISPEELRNENGIGSHLPLSRYVITHIGGKKLQRK